MKRKSDTGSIFWYYYLPVLAAAGILLLPEIRNFFSIIGQRWFYLLLFSSTLSYSLTPFFRWSAMQFGILDRPDKRKSHLNETPLLGGCAVFVSFLSAILINRIYSQELMTILVASTLLFLIGLLDDIKEIPASIKLAAQVLCSGLVISAGIVLDCVPDSLGIFSTIGNIFLTVVWIIGITNAMNFFDGMNGLAAGLAAIISFFLGITAFQTNQPFLGWIAVAMIGSCTGFLPFNFKKKGHALIFLGDAGSTVLGFILACVAVSGEWSKDNPVVSFVSPVLIFWVLIFDMVHITLDRIFTGKVDNFHQWVEYVGKDHLHHRLAHVFGGARKSVIFIYLLSFCLGTSAIALRNARVIDAILLLMQAAIVVVLITFLERRGRRLAMECKDHDLY